MRSWLALAAASLLTAQVAPFPGLEARGAFALVKELTETVGPRLTGSPADHAAHAWAAQRFRDLGLQVTQERVPLSRTWIRGRVEARLGRADRPLRLAQIAWSPGTPGPLTAPLVRLARLADLDTPGLGLAGAIVLAGSPVAELDPPQMLPPLRLGPPPPAPARFPVRRVLARLKAAGALAVLTDAGKSGERLDMEEQALDPGGPELPEATVAHGDYQRLWEEAGGAFLTLRLEGRFGPPGHTFNTVAELRGRTRPDEWVLLGAHLDSWDLGTGAMDNGAGVAAVLEAVRLLVARETRPERSLRFALFGGEEQGMLGSSAYAAAHRAEFRRGSAAFILDTGAGAVDGLALQGRREVAKTLAPVVSPLRALGVTEVDLRAESGTDHLPLLRAGLPAFCLEQRQHGYARDHHSEADTLDAVDPAELQQCAVVLAHLAWGVANLKHLLPR